MVSGLDSFAVVGFSGFLIFDFFEGGGLGGGYTFLSLVW